MLSSHIISISLLLIGTIGILIGIHQTSFIVKMQHINQTPWKILYTFLFIFLFGYLFTIYFEITQSSHNILITHIIFCLGGIFVALITTLSKATISSLKDMTILTILNKQLKYNAEHDGLTDLYQKPYLIKALEKACYFTSNERQYILIFVDLNNFKFINDKYGHLIGDEALKIFSNSLSSQFRKEDIVARYGGDEFAILVEKNNPNDEISYGEKLLALLSNIEFFHENKKIPIQAAIGITSTAPGDELDFNKAIHRADNACYKAKKMKEKGSNYYVLQAQFNDAKDVAYNL